MPQVFNYLRESNLIQSQVASDCLNKLHEVMVKNKVINYYLETNQSIDKVLNIFIRVNSGGTILSYSDLLLSVATTHWKDKIAREEINDFLDQINQNHQIFKFNKDFILKCTLVLSDLSDIAFKVKNFSKENMILIESEWEEIKKSISLTCELVKKYGFTMDTLTSSNALIPIAYYLKKIKNPPNFNTSNEFSDDRNKLMKWLLRSLVKRVFSGQPDNVLRPLRNVIRDNLQNGFPFDEIINHFKGDPSKSLIFSDDEIEALTELKYNNAHTYSVLLLLYPHLNPRNSFHMDHIFPKSQFKRSILRKRGIDDSKLDEFITKYDYISNLQLLEGSENEEKGKKDFVIWLNEKYPNAREKELFLSSNLIPVDSSLDFPDFLEFFNNRQSLIIQKLKNLLI
jgi:hypothetical protein